MAVSGDGAEPYRVSVEKTALLSLVQLFHRLRRYVFHKSVLNMRIREWNPSATKLLAYLLAFICIWMWGILAVTPMDPVELRLGRLKRKFALVAVNGVDCLFVDVKTICLGFIRW